jgi:hypothetical protein
MAFRKVLEIKEISMQYSSNGVAKFDFFTDLAAVGGVVPAVPGALASALSAPVDLPSTLGVGKRQTVTIPLDGVRATEFYPKITPGISPGTQFELYSMTAYIRPIGVYLNGGAPNGGEIWQTAPLAPGV